jgi:hypothetical protein
MIPRSVSRRALIALFGTTLVFAACAEKKTKSKDSDDLPTADGGGGDQPPASDAEDAEKDLPPAGNVPSGKPKPQPKPNAKPAPYGQHVDPTVASIQKKLLDVYCIGCHQGENASAGLDLASLQDHLDGTVRDSFEGYLIVPGAPERSLLALVIDPEVEHSPYLPAMPPPEAQLPAPTAQQVSAVKEFIAKLPEAGAVDGGDDEGEGDDGRSGTIDPDIQL